MESVSMNKSKTGNERREELFLPLEGRVLVALFDILNKKGTPLIYAGEHFTFIGHDTVMRFKIMGGERALSLLSMTEETFNTIKVFTGDYCMQRK